MRKHKHEMHRFAESKDDTEVWYKKSIGMDMTERKHLKSILGDFKSKEERNISVIEALDDGYGQAEVGRYLKITASAIAKVRKKFVFIT